MKSKSMFSVIIFFLFAMSINMFAQMGPGGPGGDPKERLKKNLEDLKTRLKLTDVQYKKVDTILTAQMTEMGKIRDAANGDREAMRTKMTELRDKTDKKINALLTKDQQAEYKKIQEERQQRMQQFMNRGSGQ
jgi:hypothetical protein